MYKGTVTIQQAILKWKARGYLPMVLILLSAIVLASILYIFSSGVYALLVFVGGVFWMVRYGERRRTEWRLWAYDRVTDIHQLQRSAELAMVLKLRSHDKIGVANAQQKERLISLIARFDEEQVFEDDASVPQETMVRPSSIFSDSQMLFKLNDEGITSGSGEFVPWSDVQHERIAFVSFSRTNPHTGGEIPAGSMAVFRLTGREISTGGKGFFRFECSLGRMEYPISSLNIEAWKLDLLLYIYRGRYEVKRNA